MLFCERAVACARCARRPSCLPATALESLRMLWSDENVSSDKLESAQQQIQTRGKSNSEYHFTRLDLSSKLEGESG